MVLPNDWGTTIGNELRKMEKGLHSISRMLHEHNRTLEVAVEGKYANEMSDPRVRLLGDALSVCLLVDQQLAQLHLDIERILHSLQPPSQTTSSSGTFSTPTNGIVADEIDPKVLTTSISHLKQERNELETLYDIAHTLNSTLEFDEVLRLVMDRVITFVGAERGFLALVRPNTDKLEFAIERDESTPSVTKSAFATASISRNTVKRVISTRKPVLTDDTQLDNTLKAQESILAYGIRSIMCAPLIVRGDCIGAVYVDSRLSAKIFEPKHRELLFAFCNQAAIAIDNARLFQKIKQDKQYVDNIFGSIANGVITTNSDGIVTTFNEAASLILCLQSDQVIGKHYREAFKTISQVGLVEMLGDAYVSHEHSTLVDRAVECSIPGREHDGVVYLNCYVRSLRETDGTYIGMALVIADQTELKRSQTELKRSKAKAKEIRKIFEKYVHPKVVEELIENPQSLKLGGETKEISVIFADIRGYTRLSENMHPEEVMNLVNRYYTIMCDAIWEEEGTLTPFQGDALMAFFNAPLLQKRHALHAVRAAWKMRMAVIKHQSTLPEEDHISFGIGVNTGLATVGNVGAPQRLQNYTAIGDVVNIASRLQSNAIDNNILLNATTYAQVYRYVQVSSPFALSVKNKSAPLAARQLLGLL